jgi:predicted metalloprotease with PDZ domain
VVWPWRATGYLGARVEALNPDLASYFGVAPGSGVLVLAVSAGAPAEKAGLKPGDVLTRLDSSEIRSPADLAAFLRERVPDSRVAATVVRHGREERIDIALGVSSTLDQLLDQLHVERDDIDSLLGELRGRVNGGQEQLAERMKKLEAMILELQRKMDELVDRSLR